MNIAIDYPSLSVNPTPKGIAFVEGKQTKVVIQFLNGITAIELANNPSGCIAITHGGTLIAGGASAGAWTKTGTGTSALYTVDLDCNTTGVTSLFGSGASFVNATLTVDWNDGTDYSETRPIAVTIYKANFTGSEGTPTEIPDFKATDEQAIDDTDAIHWTTPHAVALMIASKVVGDLEGLLGYTPVSPEALASAIEGIIPFDPTSDPNFTNGLQVGNANQLSIDTVGNLGTSGYVGASNGIYTDNSGLNPNGSIYGTSNNFTVDTYGNIKGASLNFGGANSLYDDSGLQWGSQSVAMYGANISNFVNDMGYLTSSGNPFDQSLNTTDSPSFASGSFFIDPYNGSTNINNALYVSGNSFDECLMWGSGYDNGLWNDGSASFANGALTIVNDGSLSAASLGIAGIYLTNDSGTLLWNGTAVGGGGNPFDQSLNTTDSPTFFGLTVDQNVYAQFIYGTTGGFGFQDGSPSWIASIGFDYTGKSINLCSDGSASFAFGAATIDGIGNALFNSLSTSNGFAIDDHAYLTGVSGVTIGGIYLDQGGWANFGNGRATIDSVGVLAINNAVSSSTDNVVTDKVEIVIGGVTYYLLATTSAT